MNEKVEDQMTDREDRNPKKGGYMKFILMGLIILAAFLAGTVINRDRKDTPSPDTNVAQKESKVTEAKSAQPEKTPKQVVTEYYTAIKTGNFEKAASYISENAKKIDERLAENTAGQLHKEQLENPLVDFVLNKIEQVYDEKHWQVSVDYSRKFSPGYTKSSTLLIELENGIWKVNPTDEIRPFIRMNKEIFNNGEISLSLGGVTSYSSLILIGVSVKAINRSDLIAPNNTELGERYSSQFTLITDQGTYTVNSFASRENYISSYEAKGLSIYFDNAKGIPQKLKMVNFYASSSNEAARADQILEVNF